MIYYKAICNAALPGSDESEGKRSRSKITAAIRAATEDLHGRLIITFNYRNEPVQTTLDEIIAAANHSSDIDCLASPQKKAGAKHLLFLW